MFNATNEFSSPEPSLDMKSIEAEARFLNYGDLPALLDLESEKWDEDQAASGPDMVARIAAHPELCIGGFCAHTGRMLASLFLKPVAADFWRGARDWQDCTEQPAPERTDSLFGISMSSRAKAGVDACLDFLHFHALDNGWTRIYLGSPVPGLQEWRRKHPDESIDTYVFKTRHGLPKDPQLKYYNKRGFKDIVAVKPDYFPHGRSLDCGVIISGFPILSTERKKHNAAKTAPTFSHDLSETILAKVMS